MSILFKGNLEEGNYTLIKSIDGWVLKGEISYAGFNFADRPQGEWKKISPARIYECSECGQNVMTNDIEAYKFCHGCGADMKGKEEC